MGNDWKNINIPICLRYNETYDQDWTKKEITESNASLVIFHHEHDLFGNIEDYKKMLPEIKFEYIPHSAEKTVFKEYPEVAKDWDVLLVLNLLPLQTLLPKRIKTHRQQSLQR